MADRSAARRYARAFIELAQEAKKVDALGDELTLMKNACQQDDGLLMKVVCNPAFLKIERRDVLSVVMEVLKFSDLTSNLFHVMLDKERMSTLPDMLDLYSAAADELNGRVRVRVSTAEPLTAEMTAEVKLALQKITGQDVVLDTHTDEALIGGLVARVGGTVYDASIRTRLNDIRQRLLTAQIPAEA
jgi:F-type H+-transporting ATPase subunit delta